MHKPVKYVEKAVTIAATGAWAVFERMTFRPRLMVNTTKLDLSLDMLEKAPPMWKAAPDYGHLTLAAALGYMDFRHAGTWRKGRPKLVAWLDAFGKAVPSFEATRPTG